MSPNFIPTQYAQMLVYAKLGMEDKVQQKVKLLNEITGFTKHYPAATIWTDEKLMKEQDELADEIFAKYRID